MGGHTGLQENLCEEGCRERAQALDHRWLFHPHQVAKKLHPSETLFSELADTQLWKTPLQGSYNVTIQYVINQCDSLC